MKSFLFTDDPSALNDDGTFVLSIPSGLADKRALLACYSEGLRFPSYFGWNWDAFNDCLQDLSWIREPGILIVHSDVPLAGSIAEQKVYLEILASAISDWTDDASRRFAVVFPRAYHDALQSIRF